MITIAAIQIEVAREFGLPVAALTGDVRTRLAVEARDLAMHLAQELTRHSFARIGRAFGDRDHSTAILAVKRCAARLAQDQALRHRDLRLQAILRERAPVCPYCGAKGEEGE